jgi:hypothetical protein
MLMGIWLLYSVFKITRRTLVPLTKFDIRFEAISDVYFYENHVETLFNITEVKMLQSIVILTFP